MTQHENEKSPSISLSEDAREKLEEIDMRAQKIFWGSYFGEDTKWGIPFTYHMQNVLNELIGDDNFLTLFLKMLHSKHAELDTIRKELRQMVMQCCKEQVATNAGWNRHELKYIANRENPS